MAQIVPVTGISLNFSNIVLNPGETEKITATIYPNNATDKDVTWTSSDPSCVYVNGGYLWAGNVGKVTITATASDGKHKATCSIQVKEAGPIKDVELSEYNIHVGKGDNYHTNILAEVIDEDGTDDNGVTLEYDQRNIAWITMLTKSSAPTKTWLSISGLHDGVTKVKVRSKTDPSKYKLLVITVGTGVVAGSVELDKTSIVVPVGKVATVKASVITEPGVDDYRVSWETSGSGYITATADGPSGNTTTLNIKGSLVGNVRVRVYSEANPAAYAYLDVTVGDVQEETRKYTPVDGVSISPSTLRLELGKTAQLSAVISPDNATYSSIDWSATTGQAAVVSVDRNGLVSGIQVGSGTVNVSVNGITASAQVQVVNPTNAILARGVEVTPSELTLSVGQKAKLTAAVYNANTTNKGVVWYAPDNSVASVDQNGNVKALRVGSSSLVAKSADGNAQASVLVTVVSGGQPSGDDDLEPTRATSFFSELGEDEEITDITSVGNTLIISTPLNMYYYLWKEGAYHFLGNRIPVPALYFRIGDLDEARTAPSLSVDKNSTSEDADQYESFETSFNEFPVFTHNAEGDISEYGNLSTKYVFDPALYDGFFNAYVDSVWSMIDRQLLEQNDAGKAVFPIFVRYAVRLYDGTLYAQSIPILMGADVTKFVDIKAVAYQAYIQRNDNGADMTYANRIESFSNFVKGYSVFLNVDGQQNIYDGWDDIVKGVEVFTSRQMYPNHRNAAKIVVEYTGETTYTTQWPLIPSNVFSVDVELDPYYSRINQDELIRFCQNTYLAKSFSLDDFKRLSGDTKLDINFSSDYILSQEVLKETPWSMHYNKNGRLFNYNKKLLMSDVEQVFYSGYPFLHSVEWSSDALPPEKYRIVYYLRGENGENVVISRDVNGQGLITPKTNTIVNGTSVSYHELPCSWLAYPDSRCYRIDLYVVARDSIGHLSYQTKVFDQADVAYVFTGFGDTLTRPFPDEMVSELPNYENITYKMPGSILVSKANNPFVFPTDEVLTFNVGEIMNLAVATLPLSEGQFGQFPLYVFTDEGVYALSVNNEGKFMTSHPVSRDILIARDALTGIEQGVFFAAARGLLLLQGSTVTKVSEEMDGVPSELSTQFAQDISRDFLGNLRIESPENFSDFISDCKMVYDYANKRIVIFRADKETQYVYKFDTQSWHRMNTGIGPIARALNAFPEALVVSSTPRGQSVYNLSVTAETKDATPVPGLIYTRDLALDAADIYKNVSRLKVRGRYRNGHVRWQLEGSNDGVSYTTIHSLRGPSWKWYRLVLVTMLDPGERVSYVEFDYDGKFLDKIR